MGSWPTCVLTLSDVSQNGRKEKKTWSMTCISTICIKFFELLPSFYPFNAINKFSRLISIQFLYLQVATIYVLQFGFHCIVTPLTSMQSLATQASQHKTHMTNTIRQHHRLVAGAYLRRRDCRIIIKNKFKVSIHLYLFLSQTFICFPFFFLSLCKCLFLSSSL